MLVSIENIYCIRQKKKRANLEGERSVHIGLCFFFGGEGGTEGVRGKKYKFIGHLSLKN